MAREAFCAVAEMSIVKMPGGVSLGLAGVEEPRQPASVMAAHVATTAKLNRAKARRLGAFRASIRTKKRARGERREIPEIKITSIAARAKKNSWLIGPRGKFRSRGAAKLVAVALGPPVPIVTVKAAGCPAVTLTVVGLTAQVSVTFGNCNGQTGVTVPLKVASGLICKLKVAELPGMTFWVVEPLAATVIWKSSPVPESWAVCGLEASASAT